MGVALTDLQMQMVANLSHVPTPKAMTGGQTSRSGDRKDELLMTGVPTPTAHDAHRGGQAKRAMGEERHGSNLQDFAMLMAVATPSTRDYKSASASDEHHAKRASQTRGKPLSEQLAASGPTPSGSPAATASSGQLNPAYSRWLMGLPAAWDIAAINASRKLKRTPRPKRASTASDSTETPS